MSGEIRTSRSPSAWLASISNTDRFAIEIGSLVTFCMKCQRRRVAHQSRAELGDMRDAPLDLDRDALQIVDDRTGET